MLWFKKLTKGKKRKKKSLEEKEKLMKKSSRGSKRELHLEKDIGLDFLKSRFKKSLWVLPSKKITVKK